jgi:hypothetical protein
MIGKSVFFRRVFCLGLCVLLPLGVFAETTETASGTTQETSPASSTIGVQSDNLGESTTKGFTPTSVGAVGGAIQKTSYTYTTDEETEIITEAIKNYNSQNPNQKINEISEKVIDILRESEFLRITPKSIADLVLRDGRVMRRVKEEAPTGEILEPGTPGSSLNSSVYDAVRVIGTNDPVTDGNRYENAGLKSEERTGYIKVRGEYKEKKTRIPKLPVPPPLEKKSGTYVAPRPDRLSQELSGQTPTPDKVKERTDKPQ